VSCQNAQLITGSLSSTRAADVILNDLRDYPKAGKHREEDKKQLGNALVGWAMLTVSQIERELGWAPDRPPHPFAQFCYGRSTT
jgi:hypothetical protein